MSHDDHPSPYLTTAEAAQYLRFKMSAGIRSAVRRGDLVPAGTGPRGCHLFHRVDLDGFTQRRSRNHKRTIHNQSKGIEHDPSQRNQEAETREVSSPRPRRRPENRQTLGDSANLSRKPARRARHANDTTRADRPRRTASEGDAYGVFALVAVA